MFIAALFTTARTWKQGKKSPSTDEWIKKMWRVYIYTHTIEYYSFIKTMK